MELTVELSGNFLYVLGGYTGENGAALVSGEYADISSGCPSLWQSLPNMNHWRVSAGSEVVADRLFVAGGGRHGSTTNNRRVPGDRSGHWPERELPIRPVVRHRSGRPHDAG